MLDRLALYDALYLLAAGEGRKAALFGDTQPLASEAFSRSLAGDEFPIVWFELPMLGRPRFDLHVALGRAALTADPTFAQGAGNGYDELFAWYGSEEGGGGGLAFAYDTGEGRIADPAVHVCVNNAPLGDMDRFFGLASGAEAAQLYRDFAAKLPLAWHVWYAGVHPGRPGSPVRVDCLVSGERQTAYAQDLSLFEADLRACGFTAFGPGFERLAELVLASPFQLELQFDVLRDGSLGPTLGLSDDRWKLIADAAFARHVAYERENDSEGRFAPCVLFNYAKVKFTACEPQPAKFYLMLNARELES